VVLDRVGNRAAGKRQHVFLITCITKTASSHEAQLDSLSSIHLNEMEMSVWLWVSEWFKCSMVEERLVHFGAPCSYTVLKKSHLDLPCLVSQNLWTVQGC
jgi:hypothetical protein